MIPKHVFLDPEREKDEPGSSGSDGKHDQFNTIVEDIPFEDIPSHDSGYFT